MLTDGLGLLGGTLIFMVYGEHAYEVLLGFGFGGTLLALFMRVGGGIYTKAADVGADLVGKVEAGIPEDDPRNAATIADNVGDNVGDCAGMAADIFESYEVTIVAAMILGYASFGHKGVIFPLLVRAIGVLGSIWSTYTVKAGPNSTSDEAIHSVHHGFVLGSIFSVIGFVLLGFGYLHFDKEYYAKYPQALGGAPLDEHVQRAKEIFERDHEALRSQDAERYKAELARIHQGVARRAVRGRAGLGHPGHRGAGHATGLDLPDRHHPGHHAQQGDQLLHPHPVRTGEVAGQELPDRPRDQHHPGVCRRLRVGGGRHAGHRGGDPALGDDLRRRHADLHRLRRGDVRHRHADPDRQHDQHGRLRPGGRQCQRHRRDGLRPRGDGRGELQGTRQILADLDAVGNTTKAETKGIAIGSAVIAAVSLFASFIAVIAVKSEDKIGDMTLSQYTNEAAQLSVAYPYVFVGALIGGVVPFLFSSMLIRAVGRAAFLIVKECRVQFRDKEVWAGTKKPDYGRVVNICTATAQSELIGPAMLAILMPILVGIFLGSQALGGFLAGMIVVGQLLAVFMANAGGAWDNAKKLIEDGIYGGKGSEAHKAAVTGDTVGDPLKDTAGPALNPLIKVMNMVSLLAIVPIIAFQGSPWLYLIGVVCLAGVAWAVWRSKTESKELREMEAELASSAAAAKSFETVGTS